MDYKKSHHRFKRVLSFPLIWLVLFPLLLLDAIIEIYHRLCFPLYGIEKVKRSSYIKMDRYKIKYLPLHDKINCAYCEYANGLLPYAAEIAARTEKYWCGIKHQSDAQFNEPKHHKGFIKYEDQKSFESISKK